MTVAPKHIIRGPIDRAVYRFVTFGWQPERVSKYAEYMRRYMEALPADIVAAFELLDVKATGLLTHVSLMIAGLGLIAPLVVDNDIELGIIVTEIAVYLLIAVGCLRCLAVFNSRELGKTAADVKECGRHELILRRELYSLCNRVAIIFTIVVFLVLPVLYFWKPERHL